VTGWAPTNLGGGAAFVARVPQNISTHTPLRQLWVADSRASRTALNGSALSVEPWVSPGGAAGYTVPGGIPSTWLSNSTTAIEFTFATVVENWIEPRCTVASIDGDNVTLASPCGAFLWSRYAGHSEPLPQPVRVEAVPQWPLPPGTFFHDVDG
jgi:hypothetical protein